MSCELREASSKVVQEKSARVYLRFVCLKCAYPCQRKSQAKRGRTQRTTDRRSREWHVGKRQDCYWYVA